MQQLILIQLYVKKPFFLQQKPGRCFNYDGGDPGTGFHLFFCIHTNNEKSIQQQRFRALQNIDKNIHAKVENSVGLLNNLLSNIKRQDRKKEKISGNISSTIQEPILLLPNQTSFLPLTGQQKKTA